MSKNLRTIIILLIVLALCVGLFVAVTMIATDREEQEAAEAEASIIEIGDIVDALYIGITTSDRTMEFINNGDSWSYYQDENFPLQESYMTAIVDAAVGLTALREIENTDGLNAYGFAEGSYLTLRIIDSENNVFALDIGYPIGDGSMWYARDPAIGTLYVISGELPSALDFELNDMIELEAFGSFEAADIKSITVTDGETQLVYQQETETIEVATGQTDEDTGEEVYEASTISTWYDVSTGEPVLVTDITTPSSLAESAAAFEFLSCRHYDASESLLEESGIASPSLTITVTWTDISGAEVSQTLTIGRPNSDGNYWVKLADSTAVYEMAGTLLEPFRSAMDAVSE